MPPKKILVPGCGTGYEVRLFAERGHDVLGIDFSDAAIEAAQRELDSLSRRWPDWGRRVAELVRPGGELAGFFHLDGNQRGPPFGVSRARLHQLLGERFDLTGDEPVPPAESIPVFQRKEIWQVWRRRL